MSVTNHPTVMVADSYEDTRFLLKLWLEREGYCVVEASNGQEALELTRAKCPDLILMSLRMPVLNGLEATWRIRESGKDSIFPIVAMSTDPTRDEHVAAVAAGCNAFIAEPFDFESVSDVLSQLLPGSAGQQLQDSR